MRDLLLLCALAATLILVCKRSDHGEDLPHASAPVAVLPPPSERALVTEVTAPTRVAHARPLLSLLTLGAAVLGAVSSRAAESPLDPNAQLAARIVDTTAQLEASAERIADARAR